MAGLTYDQRFENLAVQAFEHYILLRRRDCQLSRQKKSKVGSEDFARTFHLAIQQTRKKCAYGEKPSSIKPLLC